MFLQLDLLRDRYGMEWFAQTAVGTDARNHYISGRSMSRPVSNLAELHQQLIWLLGINPGFNLVERP